MEICGLQTDVEYYYDRSREWEWIDGTHRWWEIFVVITGLNGGGGLWCEKRWRWNGSSETIRSDILTTKYAEGKKIIDKIKSHFPNSTDFPEQENGEKQERP